MKYKMPILLILLGIVCGMTIFVVYSVIWNRKSEPEKKQIEEQSEQSDYEIPESDSSIVVSVDASKTKENAVLLVVSGLASKIKNVEYELIYESEGIFQGVNNGSKPIDTSGKDSFEREVYLGTCSKNTCRPHEGVSSVTVTMIFTDLDGKKSQFSKEFSV